MKTKSRILIAIALFAGFTAENLNAQEAVKALIKKCETMETVDINTIRSRDPETKELLRSIVSINVRSNPSLVKDFQNAFQADYQNAEKSKGAADREVITRRGGKIVNLMYTYGNTSYNFSVTDESNATISVVEGNGKVTIGEIAKRATEGARAGVEKGVRALEKLKEQNNDMSLRNTPPKSYTYINGKSTDVNSLRNTSAQIVYSPKTEDVMPKIVEQ
jgi:hypothetical protein